MQYLQSWSIFFRLITVKPQEVLDILLRTTVSLKTVNLEVVVMKYFTTEAIDQSESRILQSLLMKNENGFFYTFLLFSVRTTENHKGKRSLLFSDVYI